MASKRNAAPIIIKKVKAANHGGAHHGGAWKVAYADFVTAMMSFFLLLWLLNVTTDVQKRGIADYFEPTITSKSNSGAGGVLGGLEALLLALGELLLERILVDRLDLILLALVVRRLGTARRGRVVVGVLVGLAQRHASDLQRRLRQRQGLASRGADGEPA